jgi:hypothetical protein
MKEAIMAPQPRLTVQTDSKVVGNIIKNRTTWSFRLAKGLSLSQPIKAHATLKELGEEIKQAMGVKAIQFHEIPHGIKAPQKKKSRPRKKRRKPKLAEKEWRSLEAKQSKFSPRPVSMESRASTTTRGRSVSGGLPGLGKRR